ncbi:hypothetical protein MBUL_04292 [Methylobacterium bullatum]|uniref:Uncharacterized protein n=1 Tax=Methylobacterium bullatum TaxID=570505 RepID=A0A679JJW8_9HYPH|nr:hypothetical protein MBUL_04292 [Methylobacterium bullatum]
MTITVSLNALGLLKALDVVTTARMEALRDGQTGPKLVSVDVGAPTAPTVTALPAGQDRVVDVMV